MFAGAILSLGYIILLNQNNNQMAEKDNLASASAKSLAEGSIDALISGDFELLDGWLKAVILTDVYSYGFIASTNGNILAHSDSDKIATYTDKIKAFHLTTSRYLTFQGRPVKEIIYASQIDDEVFANAHVAYYIDQDLFYAFKSGDIYILLGVMFFFLGLILSATLLIIRMHTTPVSQLSRSLQKFSFKDNAIIIAPEILKRPDEIGALANTFQLMMQRLKTAYEKLKNDEQNLQLTVEQRTRDLKQQNIQLLEMQEQLIQSEKMASLGNLVAGVAHEINTPIGICLTAISYLNDTRSDVIKRFENKELSENDFIEFLNILNETCEISIQNINRAALLISNFKQVAVNQHIEDKSCFNLYDYIEHILVVLNPQLKKHQHNISISGDKNLCLFSYQGIFYQIISNLIMNSLIHAFEDKPQGNIKIHFSIKKNNLHLQYSDNGVGISKELLKKIFEPFVTTRRGEGGSGLGTHIIYNLVVQKLKGTIKCESKQGKGILFYITLPFEQCEAERCTR